MSDFDEDPDFYEDYRSGVCDQPCNQCDGRRVHPVLDVNKGPIVEALNEKRRDEAEFHAERLAEIRMGC